MRSIEQYLVGGKRKGGSGGAGGSRVGDTWEGKTGEVAVREGGYMAQSGSMGGGEEGGGDEKGDKWRGEGGGERRETANGGGEGLGKRMGWSGGLRGGGVSGARGKAHGEEGEGRYPSGSAAKVSA